ncbi:MAG: glycosyltransferase family 4 protein [Candidatus Nanoarchaeia archaeon]
MKILMLGWEFPPFNAGGLGTACHGLTKAMNNYDVDITFVLPKMLGDFNPEDSHVNVVVADNVFLRNKHFKIKAINSLLGEYTTSQKYKERLARYKFLEMSRNSSCGSLYGDDLFEEIGRYADKVKAISSVDEYDVIHAHDWMTYKAGIKAKEETGKPLVVHIHATEFDRTCGNPNQAVYDQEREGFHKADKIIAVSNFTKEKVVQHYGVPPQKVEVVHNGVDFQKEEKPAPPKPGKTVLYLGRMTMQKGPDYFLEAAKKVVDFDSSVRFVMAGEGDMETYLIERAAELGIAKNMLFAGFLRGEDIDRAYKIADLFVMPSVSEPFGITPLEAMRNNTPCIISKSSGVSEVVKHCFKVDFWDINMTSNMIIAALNYKTMHNMMSKKGFEEVHKMGWSSAAEKCISIYQETLNKFSS